jgi:predicted phage terminase large subunit-like protein
MIERVHIEDAYNRLERIRRSRYIPVFPEPKQAAFILCSAREALYGGAAGGGKSVALLIAALEWVDRPDYAALILRRTFADLSLPGALIPLSQEWLGPTDAVWNGNEHTWTFPSGAKLVFGYMDAEKDKFRYQGAAFHFVGWDELTQFTETQYRYLFSRRRRRTGSTAPTVHRSTSNPGGEGHEWVKARFVDPGDPKRPFFPARLDDNPHLDREDYLHSLDELDPITRAQLLHGDWGAMPSGGWFERHNLEIVDSAPVITGAIRYWDMAATAPKPNTDPDYTVGLLLGEGADGHLYVLDVQRFRLSPADTQQAMKRTARGDATLPVTIWFEQEGGASGVIAADYIIRSVLDGYPAFADKKDVSKKARAAPVAAQVARRAIKIVRAPWNQAFLDEMEAFPMAGHDDQVDALSGAFAKLKDGGLLVFDSGAPSEGPQKTGWEGYELEDPEEVPASA